MSEIDDLNEFNSRVSGGNGGGRSSPKRNYHGNDVVAESKDGDAKTPALSGEMWAMYGDRNFMVCEKSVSTLPAGQYTIGESNQGIYFTKVEANIDDLIELPDSATDEIIKEIETFWKKEEHFRKFGFLWKRGVLVWGAPGGGKTSCIQLVSKKIVQKGGLSIYIDHPRLAAKGLELLRHVEKVRPLVLILEDIDAIIESYGESELLALMDGELQLDNVVFVATTNYPERLDKRFINRPSRFDIVKKVGMPSPAARELYLTKKNQRLATPECAEELNQWVVETKGFSIAHIKELIVSVEVFEVPLETAVTRLKTMMSSSISSSDADGKRVGFGFNAD
jgi:AAA+ superfamily predicted ATPase